MLRKEVVPPGTIPFDGLFIDTQTPEIEEYLNDLKTAYDRNEITDRELEARLNILLKDGKIRIEKNHADPYAKGVFNQKSKRKWDQKNRNNPLSGKGKSYGKHVEDGWGQHVPVTRNDPDDIDLLDDLWNGGKW